MKHNKFKTLTFAIVVAVPEYGRGPRPGVTYRCWQHWFWHH